MSRLQRILWCAAAALFLLIAACSVWYGGRAAWGDANALGASWQVAEWRAGRGPQQTPELWNETRDTLKETLSITPDNAQLYDDLGYLHAARAQVFGVTEAGSALRKYQDSLLDEAIADYREATRLRPTFPYSWTYLALAKHIRGVNDAEMWLAFDKGLHYGATEDALRTALTVIALDQWKTLEPERQTAVRAMVALAPEAPHAKLLALGQAHGVTFAAAAKPAAAALPSATATPAH